MTLRDNCGKSDFLRCSRLPVPRRGAARDRPGGRMRRKRKQAVSRLENQVILLSVAAAMFAWIMHAVLEFYFHYWEKTYAQVLLLDIPPREIYSRVAITTGFLVAGIIIARMVRRIESAERKHIHLNACLRAVREVNQLITRERDRTKLIEGACDRLVRHRGYARVEVEINAGFPAMKGAALGEEVDRNSVYTTVEIPLSCGGNEYGKLIAEVPEELGTDPEEHELLVEVADDLAFAFYSTGADEERRRKESIQRALYRVSTGINATRSRGELEAIVQRGLLGVLGDGVARIAFCETESGPAAAGGVAEGGACRESLTQAEIGTLAGCVARAGVSLRVDRNQIDRMAEEGLLEELGDPPAIWAGTSFEVAGEVGGVFWMEHPADPAWLGGEEMEILKFVADQIGKCVERQRADEAIREQKEQLQIILDSVPAYISYKDLDGRYLRVNRAFAEMTGIPKEKWVGHTIEDLLPGAGEDRSWVDAEVAKSGEPKLDGLEVMSVGEGMRWLRTDRFPYRDKNGDIVGVISLSTDVTDRRQAEADLAVKEEQLRRSQKMEAVGLLAGGIAHDFNNLLTAISGYAELTLSKLNDEDPLTENIGGIRKASAQAAALIRQLLAFSRRQPIELAVTDLNAVVTDTEGMLRRLIGEDIELVTEFDENLPAVNADPSQLEQIIVNLAVNARDAMPEGGTLTIGTEKVALDEERCASICCGRPGTFACLVVKDTGIGMSEATAARIFEPFFTTKGPHGGTGLGLSVIYGNVKQHEGWIEVDSEPGHGTTFRIGIPETAGVPEPRQECKSVMAADCSGHGERILLVEDEELIRGLAARALSERGYSVVEARTAEEALDLLNRGDGGFDLVFSDVVLPGMSGVQLADTLLAEDPDSRILLCSGYTDGKSQWPLITERGLPFLGKPYSVVDLLKTVSGIIH